MLTELTSTQDATKQTCSAVLGGGGVAMGER